MPEIVFVGRAADPRKNVGLLLDAFARCCASGSARRFGSRSSARRRSTPLPAGVDATGHVDSVAELIRGAALFVLPSLQEGFGIVVAEALASGVPAVVTPCGGPEELSALPAAARCSPASSADELAERAERCSPTDDRLVAMRRRGRAYVVREHDPGAPPRARSASALEELDDG